MKRSIKRMTLCLLVLALLTTVLTPVASAAEPVWSPSASYRASTYYKNLKILPVTGDMAFDTVSAALSQVGYHEGSGKKQLGGDGTGSGNYTEYNLAFGKIGGSYAYAWCAAFVSWCLVQSGAGESAGGLFASCTLWVDELREIGQYRPRSSGYQPKAGDLIFFRSPGTTRASDHVGLVRYVKGGRVYTVEGNSSDRVALRNYALSDTYIVGYGLPQYGSTSGLDRQKAEDSATGVYVVTYDFLNVRASATASAAKKGTLAHGTLVNVRSLGNGWGEIEYAGGVGYISMEYADFVAPHRYRIRYVSDGKELHASSYYSTEKPRVSTLVPTRTGYDFSHWESNGVRYAARDTLPVGDHTLHAVFDERIMTETPPLLPPEAGDSPSDGAGGAILPLLPPQDSAPFVSARVLATRHAGVISGLFAVCALVWWYAGRRREEE